MKTTPQYILSAEDMNFLSRYTGKSLEELKNIAIDLKNKEPKCTDYDFIDLISGRKGTETYHALSNYRIESKKYISTFKYLGQMKTFDLNTPEGLKQHVYRNKNQFGKAPSNIDVMAEFVKAGYFISEGFSPCHNIDPKHNDYEHRYNTLSQMVYLFKNDMLDKVNKFAPFQNISFRGVAGTSFEGCQFIYSFKTGKLVTDNVNRGTWDFGKYATPSHYLMDILPWLSVGNGDNVETPEMFIMSKSKEEAYLKYANIQNAEINNDSEKNKMPEFFTTVINLAKAYFSKKTSTESLGVPGDIYEKKHIEDMKKSKEDLITNYIENRIGYQKLASCYQKDLENFTKLTTLLTDCSIINEIDKYVKYCSVMPTLNSTIVERSKNKFLYSIMNSTICSSKQLLAGDVYEMKMPFSISFYFSDELNSKLDDIQKRLGNDVFEQQCNFYKNNYIIPKITEKLNLCNAEIKTNVNNGLLDNGITFDIYLKHTVTEYEAVYANKDNIQSFATKNNIVIPTESKEELTPVKYPEYSLEANKASTIMASIIAIICGVAGVSYVLYESCRDKALIRRINDYTEIIQDELIKEYHRCLEIVRSIKKSSFLRDLKKWDITGKYDYIVKTDPEYKSTMEYECEESFIENVITQMAHELNKSTGTGQMHRLVVQKMNYKYLLLTGSPMFDLLISNKKENIVAYTKRVVFNNIDRCCANASNSKDKYRVDYDINESGGLIDLKGYVIIDNNINPEKLLEFIELINNLK